MCQLEYEIQEKAGLFYTANVFSKPVVLRRWLGVGLTGFGKIALVVQNVDRKFSTALRTVIA